MPASLSWSYLGLLDYNRAYAWQRRIAAELAARPELPGHLFLLEHPPTFTVGRRDATPYLLYTPERLRELGFAFVETDRGGLVTYHGPGQLVGYPVLRLSALGIHSVPEYVTGLEEVMLGLSRRYGQEARRLPGLRGLFVGNDKIGAIGIHVADDITTHGFAYNVAPDLMHYTFITACGLSDNGITSLQRLGVPAKTSEAARETAHLFGEVFGLDMREAAPFAAAPEENEALATPIKP